MLYRIISKALNLSVLTYGSISYTNSTIITMISIMYDQSAYFEPNYHEENIRYLCLKYSTFWGNIKYAS